jgi:hypothetical protein
MNPARQAAVNGGLPVSVPALTVNRVCGSGAQAIVSAANEITAGFVQLAVAGGMENMDRAPYLLDNGRFGYRMGNAEIHDSMLRDGLDDAFSGKHSGWHTEDLVTQMDITREAQDRFAERSQQRFAAAQAKGWFAAEIVGVEVKAGKQSVVFNIDEQPRPDTTFATLSKLRPAFRPDGTITAGNAPGLNSGAAAMLVADRAFAERKGIEPSVRLVAYGIAAVEPGMFEPRTDGLDEFGLALERQPVAGGQVRHGKILAGAAHGLSEAAAVDVADGVPVAVDEQHGLAQAAAVGRGVGVGDVGGVVQVPGVAGRKPERGTPRPRRRSRRAARARGRAPSRGAMRRTVTASVLRDQGGRRDLPHGRGIAAPIDRREGRRDVRIEVADRLVEVGQVEAVIVPLPVRILVGGVELTVDQGQETRQREALRESKGPRSAPRRGCAPRDARPAPRPRGFPSRGPTQIAGRRPDGREARPCRRRSRSGHRPRRRPAPMSRRSRACPARRSASLRTRRPRSARATSGRSRASRGGRSSTARRPARPPSSASCGGRAESVSLGSERSIIDAPKDELQRAIRDGFTVRRNFTSWSLTSAEASCCTQWPTLSSSSPRRDREGRRAAGPRSADRALSSHPPSPK